MSFLFNHFAPKSGHSQNPTTFTHFVSWNAIKQITPLQSTAKKVSFEWSHHMILSRDWKVVRDTLGDFIIIYTRIMKVTHWCPKCFWRTRTMKKERQTGNLKDKKRDGASKPQSVVLDHCLQNKRNKIKFKITTSAKTWLETWLQTPSICNIGQS